MQVLLLPRNNYFNFIKTEVRKFVIWSWYLQNYNKLWKTIHGQIKEVSIWKVDGKNTIRKLKQIDTKTIVWQFYLKSTILSCVELVYLHYFDPRNLKLHQNSLSIPFPNKRFTNTCKQKSLILYFSTFFNNMSPFVA